ncbi:flagellar basal body-associated FliL family protein [Parvibium lacunae]|uniref:Flagellar protein FliL n=1 Tax=Parvibium lacunae TaxID=1888893 RepID=A0A368L4G6_9BURK|nr:flagellar basal body-associated FliL family protein [Parvibium lacunae]RCS58322.1 hypothetical protein DU000_05735 [Parvibium lacunae]
MAKEEVTPEAGAEAAPAPKSKKKLFLILGLVIVLIAGGAGGFLFMQSKKAKEAEAKQGAAKQDAEGGEEKGDGHAANDPKHPPVFVQMDKFVFNLASAPPDKTGVGQVEMQIRVEDAKVSETIKAYMPLIRNNILLLLTSKAYDDVATIEGKKILQEELIEAIRQPLPKRADKGKDKSRGIQAVTFSAFIMN